jgi:molybdopterin molybdotransferase
MIPKGVDGVVMIEYSETFGETDILIKKSIATGDNMTYQGDDVSAQSVVLEAGTKISPYAIGLLAGLGISQVEVFARPRFAILSTGDELVDIHESTASGAIRDMNGYVIEALLKEKGAEVVYKRLVKDELEALQNAFKEALLLADHVILSGGSSVGTKDFTIATINSFEGGEVLIHGIAMKPGKPTIIGKIGHQGIIGLPGHPAAAVIVCMQILMPFLRQLINPINPRALHTERVCEGVIMGNVHGTPGRENYQMVKMNADEVTPIYAKSGILSQLTQANGYIVIHADEEGVKKGEIVKVHLYRE